MKKIIAVLTLALSTLNFCAAGEATAAQLSRQETVPSLYDLALRAATHGTGGPDPDPILRSCSPRDQAIFFPGPKQRALNARIVETALRNHSLLHALYKTPVIKHLVISRSFHISGSGPVFPYTEQEELERLQEALPLLKEGLSPDRVVARINGDFI